MTFPGSRPRLSSGSDETFAIYRYRSPAQCNIWHGPDLRVYLHRAPIDMRKGRNGLAAIVREVMQQDPFRLK